MSYDWGEFLELSTNLKNNPNIPGPKEAAIRSAVSRAYYSAYHKAMEYGETIGFQRNYNRTDHESIIAFFSSSSEMRLRYLSISLNRMRDDRLSADYDDSLGCDADRFLLKAFHEIDKFFNTLKVIT